MTETEKAIETLEGLTLCGICTGKEEGCKSCDRYNAKIQALKALHEQQEREKGTPVKMGGKNPDGTFRYSCKKCGHLFWEKDSVENYCPSCGMKLKEAQEDGRA